MVAYVVPVSLTFGWHPEHAAVGKLVGDAKFGCEAVFGGNPWQVLQDSGVSVAGMKGVFQDGVLFIPTAVSFDNPAPWQ